MLEELPFFGLVFHMNEMWERQWAPPQHQLFWAGQAHVVLISFTTEEKEGYPSLSQSVALH